MCCMITTLLLLGPRFFGAMWWLISPNRWDRAFDSFFWPVIGLVFAPWTTLMYVAVYQGGVNDIDWFWMAFAVLADVASYAGGGYGNRNRMPSYATNA
jgi:hypothetical protein